eukprot:166588_1
MSTSFLPQNMPAGIPPVMPTGMSPTSPMVQPFAYHYPASPASHMTFPSPAFSFMSPDPQNLAAGYHIPMTNAQNESFKLPPAAHDSQFSSEQLSMQFNNMNIQSNQPTSQNERYANKKSRTRGRNRQHKPRAEYNPVVNQRPDYGGLVAGLDASGATLPPLPAWDSNGTIDRTRIVEMSKTQYGSRLLQDSISNGDLELFTTIFEEIYSAFPLLMTDLFGNYLCQKVLSRCTPEQVLLILQKLAPDMSSVSCNRQGTRVMQKLIQSASTQEQRLTIVKAVNVEDIILNLMYDPHGCYVINSLLEMFPLLEVEFILDVAVKKCRELACDQHGLCVLKKCISVTAPSWFSSDEFFKYSQLTQAAGLPDDMSAHEDMRLATNVLGTLSPVALPGQTITADAENSSPDQLSPTQVSGQISSSPSRSTPASVLGSTPDLVQEVVSISAPASVLGIAPATMNGLTNGTALDATPGCIPGSVQHSAPSSVNGTAAAAAGLDRPISPAGSGLGVRNTMSSPANGVNGVPETSQDSSAEVPEDLRSDEEDFRRIQHDRLAQRILEYAGEFVNNQFGNYLVQNLLDVTAPNVKRDLHACFKDHYCHFATQKFSSNVVEKFLKVCNFDIRTEIILELINASDFCRLLQDSYGNYVIQNALCTAGHKQAIQLIEVIRPLLKTLRKNVRRKWERLLKSVSNRLQQYHQVTAPSSFA